MFLLEDELKAPSRTINRKDHDEEEFIMDLISKRKNVEEDKCKFILVNRKWIYSDFRINNKN